MLKGSYGEENRVENKEMEDVEKQDRIGNQDKKRKRVHLPLRFVI